MLEAQVEVSPAFELIRSRGNASIYTDVVRLTADQPARNAPIHFHPQVELVWFRTVSGSVWLEGSTLPLSAGQAVLLPSMQVHSFQTDLCERDWVLLQFEPFVIESLFSKSAVLAANRPLVLSLGAEAVLRMDYLCDWLCTIASVSDRSAEAQQILHLILTVLTANATEGAIVAENPTPLTVPLLEVLSQIHAEPRSAPDLATAARSARVTATYFSRMFKAKVGIGYAAYVQMHRLNTAARLLVASTVPVSHIAYQVGFSSAAHFSTAFAHRFGQSPRGFRLKSTGGVPTPAD